MFPEFFEYGYKGPTEKESAGYSKGVEKIRHTIKGDETEHQVFHALEESGEPMFVIHDLGLTPFLEFILKRDIPAGQLDFVIIHWKIGVLLVEVKHGTSNRSKAKKQLKNGERVVKDLIAVLQSQQRTDRYDKDQTHVDEHLTDSTNVMGKTTTCQTQDDVHAVEVQTQSSVSRDEAAGEAHSPADASAKETQDHADEPTLKRAWTQRMSQDEIPVHLIYAAPNDELENTRRPYIRLDKTSLENISNWFNSNFLDRSFNEDQQDLLYKLCVVLASQKTEIPTSVKISKVIDSQRFLEQSHDGDNSLKKKNQIKEQERNSVSTKDHADLSIFCPDIKYLNNEQVDVWRGPLHQIIDGTTGSGKTILLKYKALACARKGEKVRVYGPPMLRPLYEKFFQDHRIDEDIATFESVGDGIWETHGFCSSEQTCHVFIDEFQLTVNDSSERNLELLREKLPKKVLMCYWIACNRMQPLALELNWNNFWKSDQIQKLLTWLPELKRLGFHRTMLNTCVRNTRNIQDFIQWFKDFNGVTSTLPEEIRSVHPGHNIHGNRVNVYFVKEKDGDVRGESARISKDDFPLSAAFSGTIPQSELDDEAYSGIAKTIKKEIESCSSSQKCAVFVAPSRDRRKMLEAMTNQDIPVSPVPLSDSVFVSQGKDVHSYQWDTVVAICDPPLRESYFFLHNYVVFTRAISKLVVIIYTTPKNPHKYTRKNLPTCSKSVSKPLSTSLDQHDEQTCNDQL